MAQTKIEIKVGDEVTPKLTPQLKGKVARIEPFFGGIVYVLENGTRYTEEELED